MKNTLDYKFDVCLSEKHYDHKPDRETEVGKLRFYQIITDIDGFADAIIKGYCYTPIYNVRAFGMSDKTDSNFRYSSFISLDIDHSQIEMNTMLERLEFKPTIAYTSCSNGIEDRYSYRLIYLFDDKIEGSNEYSNYVYTILNANHLSIDNIDKRSLKASQYYNGNGCDNIEINVSHIVYSKSDFTDYYVYNYNNVNTSSESISLTHNTTPTTIMGLNDTFDNKEFGYDYWNMRMEDVIDKYFSVYPNIEHTPLVEADEDTPYIMFPSDYIEIRRYWSVNSDGRAVKIKDGQGRRRKLFFNGILRRLINPNITFDNLLFNLLYELVYYISNYNAENIIGKREIYHIARNVMKEDIAKYEGLRGTDRRFMVNPKYCIKYRLNKKQARNIASKMIRNQGIGELYDCSKTDKQNLEIMKENGIDISLITLKRWRKENGIGKYKKSDS